MDSAVVIDVLSHATLHPDPEIRCYAAEWLVELNVAGGLKRVLHVLDDPNNWVRRALTRKLSCLSPEQATPPLVSRLSQDADDDVRWNAANRLRRVGDLRALPALRHAYREDMGADFEGRPIARESVEAIMRIFARSFPVDRNYNDAEIEDVVMGLQSYYPEIQDDAERRLLSVDQNRIKRILRRLIHGTNPRLKAAALEAMVFTEPNNVFPFIEKLLGDFDPNVRDTAVRYLSAAIDPHLTTRLLSMLETEPDITVKGNAIDVLGEHGDSKAIAPLRRLLEHESERDPLFRRKLSSALDQLVARHGQNEM
jgi:HEAT repeat protein